MQVVFAQRQGERKVAMADQQRQTVAAVVPRRARKSLQRAGAKVGDVEPDLLRVVTLPYGWRFIGNEVLNGARRMVAIRVWHGEPARPTLLAARPRFSISTVTYHASRVAEGRVFDRNTDKCVFRAEVPLGRHSPKRALRRADRKCRRWLRKNGFPKWQDPWAYLS